MNASNFLELQMMVLENVSESQSLFEKELRKSFKWLAKDELQRLHSWAIAKFNDKYSKLIDCVYTGFGFQFSN
jgi:hypothetical protein